jgi:hypothetical protein
LVHPLLQASLDRLFSYMYTEKEEEEKVKECGGKAVR